MNSRVLIGSLLLLVIGALAPQVHAADLEIVCNPGSGGSCTMNSTNGSGTALFAESNLLPGDEVTRTFSIENTTGNTCTSLILSPTITSQTPSDFLSRFQSTILEGVNTVIGPVNFGSLLTNPSINLGTLNGNSTREFEWQVEFEAATGNAYQSASGSFDFDLTVECQTGTTVIIEDNGAGSSQSVTIVKETSSTVIQTNNNTTVNYVIIVSNTGNNSITGNTVVDLPPSGFSYIPGSWSAFSSVRGNLKLGGYTPEPTYASPGTWQLGDMVPGEVVTLSYDTAVDNSLKPGLYPDLAFAYGTGIGGTTIYANQDNNQFVGTQVLLAGKSPDDDTYQVTRQSGQVLGATDSLPATGVWLGYLVASLLLILTGAVMTIVSVKRSLS